MTVKNIIDLLQDKETPLYLQYNGVNDDEDRDYMVTLKPRCALMCEAFNNYLVESVLPIQDENSKTGYGAGLVVYLKTEIKLLKQEN